MNDKLIEFKGVTKRFGKNVVLDSIDLTIPEGKITGIIGASGEGKSTILKLISSFYLPTKGKIFYLGRSIQKDISNISKFFGLSIEEGSFYEKLTVKENLFHFGGLYSVKKNVLKKRTEEIISLVGLEQAEDTLARDLSVGMKKRLDIGCSLVNKPTLLVLDEPTADLDPLLRKQIMDLVKKINSHGTTIVLTTQLLDGAEEMCDNIAILFNEKIVEEGTSKKIKTKYKSSDLNGVFTKIFSKKNRKAYQESKKKKTKVNLPKKNEAKKPNLVNDTSELKKAIKKNVTKRKSLKFLEKKLKELDDGN